MNPTQKQFSLNLGASRKQIPISDPLPGHLGAWQYLARTRSSNGDHVRTLSGLALFAVLFLTSCRGPAEAQPTQGGTTSIQTHHQLFGPVQHEGALKGVVHGTTYVFPGSALSASIKSFNFSRGITPARYVQWVMIWTTPNTAHKARLMSFERGKINITQLAEVTGTGTGNPRVEYTDVTVQFNAMALAGIDRWIGWQVLDDGATTATFYESRLEIVW